MIDTTGQQYGSAKDYLERKKAEAQQFEERLAREIEGNKSLQNEISKQEKTTDEVRTDIKVKEEKKTELDNDVAIQRNKLSTEATRLNNSRNTVSEMNKALEERMERKEAA